MTPIAEKEKSPPAAPIVFAGKASELHYFAYGSNMNMKQIQARCTRPELIAVARLAQHRIAFFGHSKVWDGAIETVVPAPDHDVWGVIYALPFSDRDRLDSWQDVRLDGTGAYFHYPARVTDTQGQTHTVLLYKKDQLGKPRKPSREYLECIVQGAVERGLPAEYIEELRQMDAKKAEYPVPRLGKFSRELLAGTSCSDCGDLRVSKGGPGLKSLDD
jgi:cation transport regulator ChaC